MLLNKKSRGQAMVEYVLIISLVSLVFLAQTAFIQQLIKTLFIKIVNIFWYPIP